MTRATVVLFPGTNCDHDIEHLYQNLLGHSVGTVWHRERELPPSDLVILPGGFSYGDYLRAGALAKVSPIMDPIRKFAENGGPVLGVCNGFQILCETGLLPGALLGNVGRRFLSRFVYLRIERSNAIFGSAYSRGAVLSCPVAHFDGNFFVTDEELERLAGEGQILARYCDPQGAVEPGNTQWNPNGSVGAVAGVCNRKGNVVGLMPHPERACEAVVGYVGLDSGRQFFDLAPQ